MYGVTPCMGFEPILYTKPFGWLYPVAACTPQGPEECHGSTRCKVQLQQNIGGFGCRTHAAHGKFILKPPLNKNKCGKLKDASKRVQT